MDTNSFGYRLKQARLSLGVSQPVICEKVGLKVSALSRYERGDSTPSIDMAAKLAAAVNSSLDELVGLSHLSSSNTTNSDALKNVVGVIGNWDSKRLIALLSVLNG
jgi:transcriptional regulator with XRE-family HTH domain